MTRIEPLKRPGAPSYMVEQLEKAFAVAVRESAAPALPRAQEQTASVPQTNGLDIGPAHDGREKLMRDHALAPFKELAALHRRAPTPQELFDLAWPQFQRAVFENVDGKVRGPDEMMDKCIYTVRRFHEGRLPDMPTIESGDCAI